jgi:hypothetical protein
VNYKERVNHSVVIAGVGYAVGAIIIVQGEVNYFSGELYSMDYQTPDVKRKITGGGINSIGRCVQTIVVPCARDAVPVD